MLKIAAALQANFNNALNYWVTILNKIASAYKHLSTSEFSLNAQPKPN